MRFSTGMTTYILVTHPVFTQKTANDIPYMVIAYFRHHRARNARAPERYYTIICRAARYCFLRLVIFEKDIQHCFSYADDAFHLTAV